MPQNEFQGDSTKESLTIQAGLLSRLSVGQRLSKLNHLNKAVKSLALAGLRRSNPDLGTEAVQRLYNLQQLGVELVDKEEESEMELGSEDLNEVLKDVAAMLATLSVPYFVTGSVASSSLGVPRSTLDIDLVADFSAKSLEGLYKALGDRFYFETEAIKKAYRDNKSFNVIHLPSALKVDFFFPRRQPYAQVALNRRQLIEIDLDGDSRKVYFSTPEDLILSKLDWFRQGGRVSEKQWLDILGLLRVQQGKLDLAFLRKWAAELGVEDLFEKALEEVS